MHKIIMSIAMISGLTSLAEVFVIEWIKSLFKSTHIFGSTTLGLINLILAAVLGLIGYNTFKIHIDDGKLGKWVIIIMMFLNLGFSEMIYQHYTKIDEIIFDRALKKFDEESKIIEVGHGNPED
ncbi:hypothetical protein AGMMS49995_10380 [Endomicrobiia bacterium]|nr:hypothetical protein AGMMS49995_10380 [Endomicrobiia bacterium]